MKCHPGGRRFVLLSQAVMQGGIVRHVLGRFLIVPIASLPKMSITLPVEYQQVDTGMELEYSTSYLAQQRRRQVNFVLEKYTSA